MYHINIQGRKVLPWQHRLNGHCRWHDALPKYQCIDSPDGKNFVHYHLWRANLRLQTSIFSVHWAPVQALRCISPLFQSWKALESRIPYYLHQTKSKIFLPAYLPLSPAAWSRMSRMAPQQLTSTGSPYPVGRQSSARRRSWTLRVARHQAWARDIEAEKVVRAASLKDHGSSWFCSPAFQSSPRFS